MKDILSSILYLVWRTAKVWTYSLVAAVALPFVRLAGSNGGPRLLRWYLERCGAGFVKLGQILATRYDMLPGRYVSALAQLLDRTSPVPVETIADIVEQELGRDLDECFRHFDLEPMASASIAQVHKATLIDGSPVVVKVMRPRVKKAFAVDLLYLGASARALDLIGLLGVDFTGLAKELTRLTRDELDFRREGRSAQLIHDLLRKDNIRHHAPRVHFDFTTSRVLTLERLEGVWVNDMIRAVRKDDVDQLAEWADRGIGPEHVARLLLRSILEQTYRHRLFHADPHPANLVVRGDGSLGYVDFGMVGWMDEQLAPKSSRLFECIASGRLHAAYEALLETLEPLPGRDLGDFESNVKQVLWQWSVAAHNPHAAVREKSAPHLLLRISEAIRQARLKMPWEVTRAHRSLIISDAVVFALDPKLDPVEETARFYCDERRRKQQERWSEESLAETGEELLCAAIDGVRAMSKLAEWIKHHWLGKHRSLSRAARVMSLMLSYLQVGSWLVAVGAAAAWLLEIAGVRLPWAIGLPWSLVFGGAAVLAIVVRSFKRALDDPV